MRNALLILAMAAVAWADQLTVAKDSVGMEVTLLQKYGTPVTVVCNVVMMDTGVRSFMLYKKDAGYTMWFPMENFSLANIKRKGDK